MLSCSCTRPLYNSYVQRQGKKCHRTIIPFESLQMSHVTKSAFVFIKWPYVTCLKGLISQGLVCNLERFSETTRGFFYPELPSRAGNLWCYSQKVFLNSHIHYIYKEFISIFGNTAVSRVLRHRCI